MFRKPGAARARRGKPGIFGNDGDQPDSGRVDHVVKAVIHSLPAEGFAGKPVRHEALLQKPLVLQCDARPDGVAQADGIGGGNEERSLRRGHGAGKTGAQPGRAVNENVVIIARKRAHKLFHHAGAHDLRLRKRRRQQIQPLLPRAAVDRAVQLRVAGDHVPHVVHALLRDAQHVVKTRKPGVSVDQQRALAALRHCGPQACREGGFANPAFSRCDDSYNTHWLLLNSTIVSQI